MSWVLLFSPPFMLVSVVYFPKILRRIPLKAKVLSLGLTELENNFKITLFLNMKRRTLTGRTAAHYRTKLITAGERQGLRNVSTTSTICFCCEFFILRRHRSLSLHPPAPLHTLLMCTFSLLVSSLGLSLSHPLGFLTRILFVRCHKSGKAGIELAGERQPQTKQQRRIQHLFQQWSAERNKK